MSTQLILYPQDYRGYSFTTSLVYNEYVSDPYFNAVGNHTATGGTQINPSISMNCVNYNAGNWGSQILANPIIGASPNVVWVGYWSSNHCPAFGITDPPLLDANGFLKLISKDMSLQSPPETWCGVHTTVSNLTVGQSYKLNITHYNPAIPSGSTRTFMIGAADVAKSIGNGVRLTVPSPNSANTEYNFTATHTVMPLFITYIFDEDSDVRIQKVSIQEAEGTVDPVYDDLNDGQVICDLYEEEAIPLTLSVDNFTNATEKIHSYSKSFDLPNTKRNNRIFTHIFDVTKVIASNYDFNPYAITRAVLKENGVLIFDGFLRLLDIKTENGEISYNVNLFSTVTALSDVLKDKKFRNIDFSELEHEYNRTNITASWSTNGLFLANNLPVDSFAGTAGTNKTDVLKYPFVNWEGDIKIASNINPLGPADGMPELETLAQAFRPWVKIRYLIDRIFYDAGYSYTSAFFDSADFNNLFMDFNWGSGEAPATGSGTQWAAGGPDDTTGDQDLQTTFTALYLDNYSWLSNSLPSEYNTTTRSFEITSDGTYFSVDGRLVFKNKGIADDDIECRWAVYDTASGNPVLDNAGNHIIFEPFASTTINNFYKTWLINFDCVLESGQSIRPEAKAATAGRVMQQEISSPSTSNNSAISGNIADTTVNQAKLEVARGDLGQFEFLKGIMTMFNLIAMPDPNDNSKLLIEPYKDVYGFSPTVVTPKTLNWTNKVNADRISLKPLDLKAKAVFKYEEDDDDAVFNIYKNYTLSPTYSGIFGSKSINTDLLLGVSGNSILEGEEEIVASPFACTLIKPILHYDFQEMRTPAIYSGEVNEYESFANAPRILYNNGIQNLVNMTYYIPSAFGVSSINQTSFLMFSNVSNIQNTLIAQDYNFGWASPIGWNNYSVNNLYAVYYQDYFTDLYNPNTRTLDIEVDLNASDINTFRFFDKVRIKNREYRVNKIDYKPAALSKVQFILIN